MPHYLLFNPKTDEIRGPLNLSPAQVVFNTEGGAFDVFEMETDDGWRDVKIVMDENRVPTGFTETYNFDLVRAPLLRKIQDAAEAKILPLLVTGTRGAINAAKVAEARNLKGPTPLLDAEANGMGIKTAQLAKQVLERADEGQADAAAIGAIEAKRRNDMATVRDATDLREMLRAGVAALA